ncbi:MAG: OmpA family protein [Sandaracinaceae bacterium]
MLTDFDQTVNGIFYSELGAIFRFADDSSGYLDEGGSIAGNLWLAPHVGFFFTENTGGLLLDASVGYDFSIVNPVSIGPFLRGGVGFNDVGIAPFFAGGVQVSIEFEPLREGPQDRDGDGVYDREDQCRRTPPGVAVDAVGCSDVDGDGVYDHLDRCEATPRGMPVDSRGCPDTDGDGVYDPEDQCPDTPEGAEVDARGCVVLPPELVLDGIAFEFGSAAILPSSETTLRGAAQALIDNPEVRVEIGGHTDDIGSANANRQLSLERATSVRDWLIAHGVLASRLEVEGYGMTRPRVPNVDDVSRAQNRRLEFRQLD